MVVHSLAVLLETLVHQHLGLVRLLALERDRPIRLDLCQLDQSVLYHQHQWWDLTALHQWLDQMVLEQDLTYQEWARDFQVLTT